MFSIAPDDYVLSQLGARVRVLRQAREMTQAQLAEQLGVERPWVTRVELGQLAPTPGRLRGLAQVLNCCPSYLLAL